MELRVHDCDNHGSVQGKEGSVVLGAERKRERGLGSHGAIVLSLNGVLVGLLTSIVPVASKGVTVERELAYFFCQPRREGLGYF